MAPRARKNQSGGGAGPEARARAVGRRHVLVAGAVALCAAAIGSLAESDPAGPEPAAGPGTASRAGGPLQATPVRAPSGWMPGVECKPLEVNRTVAGRDAQRGLVLHVQEGENSLYERFCDPTFRSSAHFWVGLDGFTEQYVSVFDRAWTQAAGNPFWTSVETSGFATKPLTEAQVDAIARIYTWGAAEHGWARALSDSPATPGFGTHAMGGQDWGAHSCPGPLRAAQRAEILRRVASR
ncbi:N-acetylmuramoyl-L-alanine amidase [Streptomyces sp. G-G2]|uniref:peptidoglycan recognition protein family protein n=1 Tax=Streptomyces sp. G-G2 TaxID=3046201 RepID=UPI0024B8CB07|nr:N-acetylmuramoyl-L-alanine amidase [Streptomyces sp. G-G2]MDJ0385144.1 N-acetylmuramoyl-L-alanine amidase [Streptomyces sp. G-G2]